MPIQTLSYPVVCMIQKQNVVSRLCTSYGTIFIPNDSWLTWELLSTCQKLCEYHFIPEMLHVKVIFHIQIEMDFDWSLPLCMYVCGKRLAM